MDRRFRKMSRVGQSAKTRPQLRDRSHRGIEHSDVSQFYHRGRTNQDGRIKPYMTRNSFQSCIEKIALGVNSFFLIPFRFKTKIRMIG